jgi:hypothetical protein
LEKLAAALARGLPVETKTDRRKVGDRFSKDGVESAPYQDSAESEGTLFRVDQNVSGR